MVLMCGTRTLSTNQTTMSEAVYFAIPTPKELSSSHPPNTVINTKRTETRMSGKNVFNDGDINILYYSKY